MSRLFNLVLLFSFVFFSVLVSSVSSQGVAESPVIGGGGGGGGGTSVGSGQLIGGPSASGLKIYAKQLISTLEFNIHATPIPNPSCVLSAAFSLTGFSTAFVNGLVIVPSISTFTSSSPSVNLTISTIPGQKYSGSANLKIQAHLAGCEAYTQYSYTSTTLAVKVIG